MRGWRRSNDAGPYSWRNEGFSLEIDDLVVSGDRVCAIGRAGGTLDGRRASYGFVHALDR
ncbi:MAG: hypothetical protein H0T69_18060 [Thermoleophilaceae bacterium]|nr:hypothetical protein [Thermoleophilaceae bacterium]